MVKYDRVVDDGGEIGQRHILSVKISYSEVGKTHYDMIFCFWLNSNKIYRYYRHHIELKAWTDYQRYETKSRWVHLYMVKALQALSF